jgi:hypothetical protein
MSTNPHTVVFKAQNFYVACAPEAGVWSFGDCFEEAANGLVDQLYGKEPQANPRLAIKGDHYAIP